MSGVQHFELTAVLGREQTGWECVGCGAHLEAEDRDGRTYGRVVHTAGCTELSIMFSEPDTRTMSGMARIRRLEGQVSELVATVDQLRQLAQGTVQTAAGVSGSISARVDSIDGVLGDVDNVLKGLGIQIEGLRIRIEQVSRDQARRSDSLDNRLTEVEVEYRRPGGTEERLRELEKAVLNPRGTVVDQLSVIGERLTRLELAVGGLVEHGPAGHALPRPQGPNAGVTGGQARPASFERAATGSLGSMAAPAATGGPPRPSATRHDWVFRVTADEDWSEAHLRAAIGDLPGIDVRQVSFTGSVTTTGGGQGSAHSAGEPGSVIVRGTGSSQ